MDALLIIFCVIISALGIINLIATIHEPAISKWGQTIKEARDSVNVTSPKQDKEEGSERSA